MLQAYDPELEKKRLLMNERGDMVAVHHGDLDHLIARLMHVCELDSDVEHRNALKGEIKMHCRDWLNEQYASAGYKDSVPAASIPIGTQLIQ